MINKKKQCFNINNTHFVIKMWYPEVALRTLTICLCKQCQRKEEKSSFYNCKVSCKILSSANIVVHFFRFEIESFELKVVQEQKFCVVPRQIKSNLLILQNLIFICWLIIDYHLIFVYELSELKIFCMFLRLLNVSVQI